MILKERAFDNKMISARYIQRYIKMNSSEEMQKLKLFPNVKEIQESFGIWDIINWYVLQKDFEIKRDSEDVHIYVIGDGHTPRTGGLLAFLTKWSIVSVDPEMNVEKFSGKIKRCNVYNIRGEEVLQYKQKSTPSHVILIFPHSHIPNTNEVYKHFKDNKVWIINMPCCIKNQDNWLPLVKSFCFKDVHINSPENTMRIYSNYIDIQ